MGGQSLGFLTPGYPVTAEKPGRGRGAWGGALGHKAGRDQVLPNTQALLDLEELGTELEACRLRMMSVGLLNGSSLVH